VEIPQTHAVRATTGGNHGISPNPGPFQEADQVVTVAGSHGQVAANVRLSDIDLIMAGSGRHREGTEDDGTRLYSVPGKIDPIVALPKIDIQRASLKEGGVMSAGRSNGEVSLDSDVADVEAVVPAAQIRRQVAKP